MVRKIEQYGTNFQKGLSLGVQEATELAYKMILQKMDQYQLSEHKGNVSSSYDKEKNVGKVSTSDIVIIFHEFGTGIKGKQDKWATEFGYEVNKSGKGKKGWFFKNETHGYQGITHGLTAKHIFYETFMDIKKQLPKTVAISVSKTIRKMY